MDCVGETDGGGGKLQGILVKYLAPINEQDKLYMRVPSHSRAGKKEGFL